LFWTEAASPASHGAKKEIFMAHTISPEQALIYVMVTMSGVSGNIQTSELQEIGHIVRHLPAFREFDQARLTTVAQECGEILQENEGLEAVLGLVSEALSPKLRETAYALAVEVAAADLVVGRTELRFLAILRDRLGLDKLVTAALERSAIARYQSMG
jgi:tellurite resistance protein